MNRIDAKFEKLRKEGRKAFIAFITSGDPNVALTYEYVLELEKNGVDILELGVPFSDPVAEGPVIQDASERALIEGIKIDDIFELVRRVRTKTEMPLTFMIYMNCIYHYGKERFFENCRKVGLDGVIIPDLPFEEQWEVSGLAKKYGVYSIFLISPTSQERIKEIAEEAEGFIYFVSSKGVTGMRNSFSTDFEEFSNEIKKYSKVPVAVGFGISNSKQAKELSAYFDGIIMGSAFVNLIAEHEKDAGKYIAELAAEVRAAMDS